MTFPLGMLALHYVLKFHADHLIEASYWYTTILYL